MPLKCIEREPKGAKREPNGSQRVRRDAKGAQREPKDDENASKDRSRSDVRKMSPKSNEKGPQNGPVWGPLSIKNRCQKTVPKKHGNSWNLNQKSSQNRGRNVSKSLISLYSAFSENNDYRWSVCKKTRSGLPRTVQKAKKNNEKFMLNRCAKKWCKNHEKCEKMEPKMEPTSIKNQYKMQWKN